MSISSDQVKNLEGNKGKVSLPSSFGAQWGAHHWLDTTCSAVATERSQDLGRELAEGKNDLLTTSASGFLPAKSGVHNNRWQESFFLVYQNYWEILCELVLWV